MTMTLVKTAKPPEIQAAPDKTRESASRQDTKMRLHVSMITLTGIMTMIMLHLHLDQTDTALFSFGPLGPSIVTEVIDFLKDL